MARFPLIPITQGAKLKRCARKTLWQHVRAGSFDVVHIAGRTLIVDNAKWRAWEPNRIRQKATLRGLRTRRHEGQVG